MKSVKAAIVSSDDSEIIRSGGKHVHQNLLVKGLEELGMQVSTFYPPAHMIRSSLISKIFIAIRHPSVVFSYYSRYITRLRKLSKYFESINFENYDIVHGHDVLCAWKLKHDRILLTVHGYFARETLNYMRYPVSPEEKERIYKACLDIEKEATAKARHIITVDTRLKEYHVRELGIPSEKITVIYNAIDTEAFRPVSNKEKNALRRQLGLPEKSFIVLVPRRYVDKNGVTYAAEAFAKMRNENYFFVFIGGGLLKEKIKDILRFNRNVLILDRIPNEQAVYFYKASDVVLVPSITSKEGVEEATSLSMLEGMSCGKVVICTNVGGMKEVVKHMENGILIEQKNPDAIVEAVEFARKHYDDLAKLRETAREHVVNNHSYLEHAKKVLGIYSKVLNESQ